MIYWSRRSGAHLDHLGPAHHPGVRGRVIFRLGRFAETKRQAQLDRAGSDRMVKVDLRTVTRDVRRRLITHDNVSLKVSA